MKRNKVENHNAAFYELLVSLSWVTMAPPYGMPFQHAEAQKDACEFHLNRILKKFKEDPEKDKHRAFVKAFKAVNNAQCDFVKQYFKTGVEWNGKGGDLASYAGGKADAPISAAPAKKKPAAKKKAVPAGGGVAGMFSELKKKAAGGDSAAKGMKKVTKDMKTKNRKDRTGAVVMKKKKVVVKKPSKPPSMTDRGGKWMIENYWEEGVVELPEKIKTRENAFIVASQNVTFVLKQKIKAVTIDSCKKCRFFLAGVVSSVELVNCQSVTVFMQGPCPSIQIDKCDSPRIVLMKEAMNPIPNIVTSSVSAGNIEIPGLNPDDDNREMPMPEQYTITIDAAKAKLSSEPVNHG